MLCWPPQTTCASKAADQRPLLFPDWLPTKKSVMESVEKQNESLTTSLVYTCIECAHNIHMRILLFQSPLVWVVAHDIVFFSRAWLALQWWGSVYSSGELPLAPTMPASRAALLLPSLKLYIVLLCFVAATLQQAAIDSYDAADPTFRRCGEKSWALQYGYNWVAKGIIGASLSWASPTWTWSLALGCNRSMRLRMVYSKVSSWL